MRPKPAARISIWSPMWVADSQICEPSPVTSRVHVSRNLKPQIAGLEAANSAVRYRLPKWCLQPLPQVSDPTPQLSSKKGGVRGRGHKDQRLAQDWDPKGSGFYPCVFLPWMALKTAAELALVNYQLCAHVFPSEVHTNSFYEFIHTTQWPKLLVPGS